MKLLTLLFAVFILFALQITLVPHIAIGEITPDLPLLIVAFFAIHRTTVQSTVVGFVIGFLQDLFNPELLGLNALTKSLAGYGLAVGSKKAEPDNLLFLFALFGAAALAHDFVYLLFFTGLDIGRFFVLFFTVSVPSALYTAIFGALVYWVTAYVKDKVVRNLGKARR